ncbi:MAG: tetratricopeptide repeat protein [Lautropia sp.]
MSVPADAQSQIRPPPALGASAAPAGSRVEAGGRVDEATIQRELQLKRIARLKETGKVTDAGSLMPLLKDPDARIRRQSELAIWALWSKSGNPDVDRLFRAAVAQIGRNELEAAIESLTRVIDNMPGFAEAWNKRATARFLAGDLIGAMDDVERTLQLQPDHFGSLAGYGHIYFRLDDPERAVQYWERALAINPNLDGVARSVEVVRRQLASHGRLMI